MIGSRNKNCCHPERGEGPHQSPYEIHRSEPDSHSRTSRICSREAFRKLKGKSLILAEHVFRHRGKQCARGTSASNRNDLDASCLLPIRIRYVAVSENDPPIRTIATESAPRSVSGANSVLGQRRRRAN